MKYSFHTFSVAYGAGNYNSNTYNGTTSTSTSTSAQGGGSSGLLANTGFDLILGATIGSVIIFSALLIRFWRKPARKQPTQNVK